MAKKLHLDFETRSTVNLAETGIDVYANDKTTDIWCFQYAFDNGSVRLWVPGDPIPPAITTHILKGLLFYGHNVSFEFHIWNVIMVKRYGAVPLKIEQCRCTAAMAYAMSLPGSLDGASQALGLSEKKDMKGHRLMMQMCKPRKIKDDGTIVWWDDADRKNLLFEYGAQDVVVERGLEHNLQELSPSEQRIWVMDQKINQRGVPIDAETVRNSILVIESEQIRLNKSMLLVTKGAVKTTTAAQQLTEWLATCGVKTKGVSKDKVIKLLADKNTPAVCKKALVLRQSGSKSSTAKLSKMMSALNEHNRVCGTLQYHGANTGRWAGRTLQVHNFPRPQLKQHEIEACIDLINTKQIAAIDMLYIQPTLAISSCLRAMIKAKPGYDIIGGDYAAIEARVLAWLAGQEDMLLDFKKSDAGLGPEPYCVMASEIYSREIIKGKHPNERQVGKVTILQLGYQGGVGAWVTASKGYGIDLDTLPPAILPTATSDELFLATKSARSYLASATEKVNLDAAKACDVIKQRFRTKNQKIVRYWYALEQAAISAVEHPGTTFAAGPRGRAVRYTKKGVFLRCQLPSGRVICYHYPILNMIKTPWGATKQALTYMSVNGLTRKWERVSTYGGKLAENNTQGLSACLLRYALINVDACLTYDIFMHVHDEIDVEVKKGEGSKNEIEDLMEKLPKWAKGLPLKVEAWRGERYRK